MLIYKGTVYNIKQVNIILEDAGASEYYIEVSSDGQTFTRIAEEQDGISYNYKNDTMILDEMVNARYIRINGTSRNTEYGYSIRDIAVYGKSIDTKPDGTTPDTSTPDTSTPDETTTTKPTTAKPKATTKKVTKKTSLKRTKIAKKVTKKFRSKKVKLTFKKVMGAKKYTVQVSKSKKFKKVLYKKTVKKIKVTLSSKKLKNKKKLYVRVKAVGAKKWSKVVKIKVKK